MADTSFDPAELEAAGKPPNNQPQSGRKTIDFETVILGKLTERGFIPPPGGLDFSGTLFRLYYAEAPRESPASAIIHIDPPANLYIHDWRRNPPRETIFLDTFGSRKLTPEESEQLHNDIAEKRKQFLESWAEIHDQAAELAKSQYDAAPICKENKYLKVKGVKPVPGLKTDMLNSKILVPFYAPHPVGAPMHSRSLRTLLTISSNGDNMFMRDGDKKGNYFTIEPAKGKAGSPPVFCEGLATGISIWKASGHRIIIAGDAGNMHPVINGFLKANL
jgi:hypothetical protein